MFYKAPTPITAPGVTHEGYTVGKQYMHQDGRHYCCYKIHPESREEVPYEGLGLCVDGWKESCAPEYRRVPAAAKMFNVLDFSETTFKEHDPKLRELPNPLEEGVVLIEGYQRHLRKRTLGYEMDELRRWLDDKHRMLEEARTHYERIEQDIARIEHELREKETKLLE